VSGVTTVSLGRHPAMGEWLEAYRTIQFLMGFLIRGESPGFTSRRRVDQVFFGQVEEIELAAISEIDD